MLATTTQQPGTRDKVLQQMDRLFADDRGLGVLVEFNGRPDMSEQDRDRQMAWADALIALHGLNRTASIYSSYANKRRAAEADSLAPVGSWDNLVLGTSPIPRWQRDLHDFLCVVCGESFPSVLIDQGQDPSCTRCARNVGVSGVVENLVEARRSELYRASYSSPDRTTALPTSDAQMLTSLQSAAIHASRRDAALHAASLDSGKKLLTNEQLWQGHPDGTATAELPGGTTLTYHPVPVNEHSYVRHTYHLTCPGTEEPTEVHTMAGLVRLIEQAVTGPVGEGTTEPAISLGDLDQQDAQDEDRSGVESSPGRTEAASATATAQDAPVPAGEPSKEPLLKPQTTDVPAA
ncbi:hypothetical protein ACFYMW_25580 [Streptomyces sp. NPDC006692]|uniref:hypothetical protein n=1 Tax=unclassified Streptomyces TaxID=2593676 RepID=UPI00341F321F